MKHKAVAALVQDHIKQQDLPLNQSEAAYHVTWTAVKFWKILSNFKVRPSLNREKGHTFLYVYHLYQGFYTSSEGATLKILDLLTETLLI